MHKLKYTLSRNALNQNHFTTYYPSYSMHHYNEKAAHNKTLTLQEIHIEAAGIVT